MSTILYSLIALAIIDVLILLSLKWDIYWNKPSDYNQNAHTVNENGVIHTTIPRDKQELDFKELAGYAEKRFGKCNKCYGRGYSSWITELQQFNPCPCVTKLGEVARKEKQSTALFQGKMN